MTDGTTATTAPPAPTHCYRHPNVETYVRCVRCDRPICPACMNSASVGFQCPECVRSGRANVRPPQARYGGRAAVVPYATYALIVGNVVVFALMSASGGVSVGFGTGGSRSTYTTYALAPAGIALQHQYYRLVTSMFLHYGVTHILFNMLALYYVGPTLERLLGTVRFSVVYLVAGLGGSVLSYVAGPLSQLAAGASGAIFGLFGAFFVVVRQQRLDPRGIVSLIGINLALGFVIPNVDILGHVGGLVTGGLVTAGIVYAPRTKLRPLVQGVAVIVMGVVLAAATAARTHAIEHRFEGASPARAQLAADQLCTAHMFSSAAAMAAGSLPSR
jgi:membrane associated rhomboid family serine protease